jgi:hypothetical protein
MLSPNKSVEASGFGVAVGVGTEVTLGLGAGVGVTGAAHPDNSMTPTTAANHRALIV